MNAKRNVNEPGFTPATDAEEGSKSDALVYVVPTFEQIAKRAYELWLSRGCPHNFAHENWCDAERALLYELNQNQAKSDRDSS
ncbi:MAG TPA: DUF2934 domain-containing protein [Oculatellaceae cyanobacterium]